MNDPSPSMGGQYELWPSDQLTLEGQTLNIFVVETKKLWLSRLNLQFRAQRTWRIRWAESLQQLTAHAHEVGYVIAILEIDKPTMARRLREIFELQCLGLAHPRSRVFIATVSHVARTKNVQRYREGETLEMSDKPVDCVEFERVLRACGATFCSWGDADLPKLLAALRLFEATLPQQPLTLQEYFLKLLPWE
ncbi:MAG TPA: hypothetical protein PKA76_03910 [Pirellulaceae bacterium]|nr:hypothetical protein [Pirellulaceae bacterium]